MIASYAINHVACDIGFRYHPRMNSKHRRTLEPIFSRPTKADIRWADIESLVIGSGGAVEEREGSRVAMALNGVRANFHRPHPKPTTKQGVVDAVRLFLTNAGVKP